MQELKKYLVAVAVSGWEDRAVVARDTNEAKQLALAGECEVTRRELTPGRVIGTEIVARAPGGSGTGAWVQSPRATGETLERDDSEIQRQRRAHLEAALFHVTDGGGLGDTIAIGPGPNDDGTVSVYLVSALGERSSCEVVLAPEDLDNLAKASRAVLALQDVEEAVASARNELREGKIPTGPKVVA